VLDEVVVTNTIPANEASAACSKIKFLSIGKLLGEAIRRIHDSDSVSSLFV
jgi:ribose-phosphate pyrophosphokinase